MWDFYKNELMRYRGWVIAYACVHMVLLGFGMRVTDLAQLPAEACGVVATIYIVTGLLLGAYQMGGYRRPNAWLNLLHRPLPRWKIAGALFSGGATLLAFAILLPLLVVAAWQEWMTPRVLDTRHWWLVLSGWLFGLCAYFAAGYALLAPRRHSVGVLSVLVLLVASNAVGTGAVLLQVVALAWLSMMVGHAFKPDLAAPPRGPHGAILTAVPLMATVWLAWLFVVQLGELAWMMQGGHPEQSEIRRADSMRRANLAEGRDLIATGLASSASVDATSLLERATNAEVETIWTRIPHLPIRHELTYDSPMQIKDARRRIVWTFSHDSMRFEGFGHGSRSGEVRSFGPLGLDGDEAFSSPPRPQPQEKDLLVSREAVYRYSSEKLRITTRMQVPRGETIAGFHRFGERVALLTDRTLFIYEGESTEPAAELLQPRFQMPVTGRIGSLRRIDLLELPDGYVASMTYSRRTLDGDNAPFQELAHLTADGHASVIARRELSNGFGTLFRYRSWYTSPVLDSAQRWAVNLFAVYEPRQQVDRQPVPRFAWIMAIAIALASAIAAAWRLQRIDMPGIGKAAWVLACAALGLPAVVSLWLIYPPRESLAELRQPLPALGSAVAT